MKLPDFFFRREGAARVPPSDEARLSKARGRMVRIDLIDRGIRDEAVLEVMGRLRREEFVSPEQAGVAYEDTPLQIGHRQTISQPYIVAKMSECLDVRPGESILEIGSGCGYQTAVLLELGATVFAVEIIPELAATMERRLTQLGYQDFEVSCHDGSLGWPEHAPYDAIILAAAPATLPPALMEQVKMGGRIVAPIGDDQAQALMRWTLSPEGWNCEELISVRFVPLVHEISAS